MQKLLQESKQLQLLRYSIEQQLNFRTTRLATFPDYLMIQLKKFTLREDWVPIKLDVAVEMPDFLDLSPLRGAGPQPGEEPLPDLVGSPPPAPAMDPEVLKQLIDMGRKITFELNKHIHPKFVCRFPTRCL